MRTLNLFLPLWLLGLTGCSGYASQFACKPQDGLGCRSISQVNRLVDAGWPSPSALPPKKPKSWFSKTPRTHSVNAVQEPSNEPFRIWIAPYSDGNGDWNEQWIYRTTEPRPGKPL